MNVLGEEGRGVTSLSQLGRRWGHHEVTQSTDVEMLRAFFSVSLMQHQVSASPSASEDCDSLVIMSPI